MIRLIKGTEDVKNDNQRKEYSKKMEHDGKQEFRN